MSESIQAAPHAAKRPLSLAHLTVLDATPPELVTVAATAGFDQVGIRIHANPSVGTLPYDMLGDTPMLRETLRRMQDTGISVLDIEFLRFEPELAQAIPDGFLEAGARLGAQYVLLMSAEPLEARTLERFVDLCERAQQFNLHVCLENAVYTGVKTVADAARVVKQSGCANASILVDALHFSRSGGAPADLASIDASLFKYAQICDAVAEHPRDAEGLIREARTGRLWPGEGTLPLAALVAALPATIPLAMEAPVRGSAHLPAQDRAHLAYRKLTQLLA